MTRAEQILARARGLIGTRFVAQGRDPAVGLDCIGFVVLACHLDGGGVSDDYRLSGAHRAAILGFARAAFRRVPKTQARAGDVLLLSPGAAQWHVAIWTGSGLIHADIVNRKIVERPGPPDWPVAAVLRRRVRTTKGG